MWGREGTYCLRMRQHIPTKVEQNNNNVLLLKKRVREQVNSHNQELL